MWIRKTTLYEREADMRATILEYEHALEHIADEKYGCPQCTALAQSALRRDNKEDFMEIARG